MQIDRRSLLLIPEKFPLQSTVLNSLTSVSALPGYIACTIAFAETCENSVLFETGWWHCKRQCAVLGLCRPEPQLAWLGNFPALTAAGQPLQLRAGVVRAVPQGQWECSRKAASQTFLGSAVIPASSYCVLEAQLLLLTLQSLLVL